MDNENLDLCGLLEDVRRIKDSIKQNAYLFRQVLYTPASKLVFLIAGAVAAIVPLLYASYLKQYGHYAAIPENVRLWLILIISGGIVFSALGKLSAYHSARRHVSQPSVLKTLARLVSRQALWLYPGMFFTILFFVFLFLVQGNYHFILPTLAIGVGILLSTVGSFISLHDLFFFGSYSWIMGVVSVPFIIQNPRASLLWTSVIFGLGMFVFGVYLLINYRSDKEL